jgi:HEAT repeat protein
MKWKVKIALATPALVILAASVVALRRPREPEYDGQPLSYYLSSLTYSQVRLERNARDAIHDMGSNAVPHLIRILDARESRFKSWFNDLAAHQSIIRFRFHSLNLQKAQAAMACEELGPAAAATIPSLSRLINEPDLAGPAMAALAQIGPQTFPLLTNALLTGNVEARVAAAGELRQMRPRDLAVPMALQALRDISPIVRSRAAETLGALALNSPTVLSALIGCLDDTDASVRASATQSLHWFGAAAAPAVPKLLELFKKAAGMPAQDQIVDALKAIDPAAAESVGVK